MKKLQQYYIFKLSSNRLYRAKYNLSLSVREARKSGEIVSIGDSEALRTLRKIKNINTDENTISELINERKRIKRKKSSEENIQRIIEIDQELDSILFVPEIISVFVENKSHYKHIGKNGFILNGKKYIRFACGAGQARRNNALFIEESVEEKMYNILNNDRKDIEITPAKYNAYFSLSTSASLPVTTPYFCVVPDKEVVRTERVEFIREIEGQDDVVEEIDREITFNLWDGQGIISPKMAKVWAEDLELDYVPSSFIVRSNFIKGLVVVIDFHKFSDELGERFFNDVYGNKVNIRDMDVILTQSQFKLWNAFESSNDYKKKLDKNGLGWSVSRVAPEKENDYTFLNYQFVQVLNLDKKEIENLCNPTLDFFKNIINDDYRYTLLYLLGKYSNVEYDKNVFSKIHDKITKAIILNNNILEDPYVKQYLIHSLNKKIRESYIGNLIVDGQYTMMVADPYAFLEYIFGLPIKGLLNRREHYSKYWVDKKKEKIAGLRAPLTWRSEVNILNLKTSAKIEEWYSYLDNCIIYNVFGNDCLIHSGSDFDGDIVCLTDNEQVINGAYGGLPIDYENKKSPKEKINKKNLYLSDINGFDNKVGFITNVATTAFAMLPKFKKGSEEYKETINRLKCFRKEQGSSIDATKGLEIKPFPVHWTKWNKISEEDSEEEKKNKIFQNKIVINKRPYFMRYLYPHYNKKYNAHQKKWEKNVSRFFDANLDDLVEQYDSGNLKDEDKIKAVEEYNKYGTFLKSDCIMNNVCEYMEENIHLLKDSIIKKVPDDQVMLLKNKNIETDKEKLKKMYDLYKSYKTEKRNFSKLKDGDKNGKFKTMDQFNKYIRQEAHFISSNGSELANMAVDICYIIHPNDNKTFLWSVFGEDLLYNIYLNRQEKLFVPFLKKNGEINYLGEEYAMKEIHVNDYFSIEEI